MAETMDYLETLQEAIRQRHHCAAKHSYSMPVKEVFQGKPIWEGMVEVFDLAGHPKAKQAYAWGRATRDTGDEVRIVTVLGVPPVDSPRKAVQMSILSDTKSRQDR
ncbi:MAG TPA: hypothetical protein VMV72_06850 [Verrucomicrobiae bacterium]|nr:hypothetical protein [Verrucomicrobiae bacterium]